MAIDSSIIDSKLTISYADKSSFSFSDISYIVGNDKIYELAEAIVTLQDKTMSSVTKVEDFKIVNVA